jgi:hypothetical protein
MSYFRTQTLLKIFRSKFSEDLLFLLAVTLAAGFYAFEAQIPYSGELSLILTVFTMAAWLWLAFTSGFMKRGAFVAFSLAYWLIPQFIIIGHVNNAESLNYDANLHMASRFAEILVRAPLDSVSEVLNFNMFIMSMMLLLLTEISFFTGFFYREKCKDRHWYREFRKRYDI